MFAETKKLYIASDGGSGRLAVQWVGRMLPMMMTMTVVRTGELAPSEQVYEIKMIS
jgi:hypothetical protein